VVTCIGAAAAASPMKNVVFLMSAGPLRQSRTLSMNSMTSPKRVADFSAIVPSPPPVITKTSEGVAAL
jgi:hypothetical protein